MTSTVTVLITLYANSAGYVFRVVIAGPLAVGRKYVRKDVEIDGFSSIDNNSNL